MDNIKIIRLQSGEDIIADFTEVDDSAEVILDDPMSILFKRVPGNKSMMIMTPWLPVELVEDNRALIFAGDILTVLEPRTSLKQYYSNLVSEYVEEIEESINRFDESLMEDLDLDYEVDEEDLEVEEEQIVSNKQLLH